MGPTILEPNNHQRMRCDREIGPRIALYSHDTMGLGHLRRNILIAGALSKPPINANALVISGAREACHFAMSAGVDCVTLPGLGKDSNGDYSAKHLRWSSGQTTSLRSKVICASLEAFAPDILIVDKVPRGIENELDESLRMIRQRGSTRCVLGLREILDEPSAVIRQWESSDAEQTIRDHYDQVWIYGDRSVYDTVNRYRFGPSSCDRAFYTGYLSQQDRLDSPTRRLNGTDPDEAKIVCVVGGGQDGSNLAKAFSLAPIPNGRRGILITGPFMPEPDRKWLRRTLADRNDCQMIEDLVEADQYIASADRVVSMAGYNTISSILSFQKAALVVPRVAPRREQWIRARQFADRGLLTMLEPATATPLSIGNWIAARNVPTAKNNSIDMTGLQQIVRRVQDLLNSTTVVSTNNVSKVSLG